VKVVKVKIYRINFCTGVICLPTIEIASKSLKTKVTLLLVKKNSGTARVFSASKDKIFQVRLRSSS